MLEQLRAWDITSDPQRISETFETTRAGWLLTPEDQRGDPSAFIDVIGAGVGEFLVDELGFSWVVSTDEEGTELAVLGQPGDILLYPLSAVAKQWTSQEEGSIAEFIDWFCDEVRSIREHAWGESG